MNSIFFISFSWVKILKRYLWFLYFIYWDYLFESATSPSPMSSQSSSSAFSIFLWFSRFCWSVRASADPPFSWNCWTTSLSSSKVQRFMSRAYSLSSLGLLFVRNVQNCCWSYPLSIISLTKYLYFAISSIDWASSLSGYICSMGSGSSVS